MNFESRLTKLEASLASSKVTTAEWLRSLSDVELEEIVDNELKRLSDEELERIARGER